MAIKELMVLLSKDRYVNEWFSMVAQHGSGSKITENNYLRDFSVFMSWCIENGYYVSPKALLAAAHRKLKDVDFKLSEYFKWLMEGRGVHRNTAATMYAAPRSFLNVHGYKLTSRFPSSSNKSIKRIPSKEDITKIIQGTTRQFGGLRMKAQILCMKDSGLASQDLLMLKYSDVRTGLEAGLDWIHLKLKRQKSQTWFDTYLGPESTKALREYVEYRKKGTRRLIPEVFTDDTPLWRSLKKGNENKPYENKILSQSLHGFRLRLLELCRREQVQLTSHQLRKFFATSMKLSGVNDTLVEYWLGHSLPAEKDAYFVPPEDKQLEIYKQQYSNISLTTSPKQLKDDAALTAVREFAKSFGIDPMRLRIEKEKQLNRTLSSNEELKVLTFEMSQTRKKSINKKHYQHKLVTEKEMIKFLDKGWEIIQPINGKMLIRRTSR